MSENENGHREAVGVDPILLHEIGQAQATGHAGHPDCIQEEDHAAEKKVAATEQANTGTARWVTQAVRAGVQA